MDDGNIHGLGAGLEPVLAKLVAVTGMDRLDRVAEVVDVAHNIIKVPTAASLSDPAIHIVLEWTEGDESVVRRAATEDLGARVSDMAVAIGLLSGAIVVVEVTAEEAKPLTEVENVAQGVIRWASLDHEDLALGKVGGQTVSQDAAGSTTAYNNVIVGGAGRGGEHVGSHDEELKG